MRCSEESGAKLCLPHFSRPIILLPVLPPVFLHLHCVPFSSASHAHSALAAGGGIQLAPDNAAHAVRLIEGSRVPIRAAALYAPALLHRALLAEQTRLKLRACSLVRCARFVR